MRLLIPFTSAGIAAIISTRFAVVDGRRLGEAGASPAKEEDAAEETCPPARFTTDKEVDLEGYVSKVWYVHEQAPTTYLPISRNFCVTAEYKLLDRPTPFWGYTIEVSNQAQDAEGNRYGGKIYAAEKNGPSKLEVAPGFLPRFLAGPYYIVDYDEKQGYSIVVGGEPNVKSNGKCKTKNRWINSSGGLWIFTRESTRNEDLIKEVRNEAETKFGLDTSVLNRVDHTNCNYGTDGDAAADAAQSISSSLGVRRTEA